MNETLKTGAHAAWELSAFLGYYSGVWKLGSNSANNILGFHSVGGGSWGNISPTRFRDCIDYVDKTFEIVDVPTAVSTSASKQVALTFDDGFKDFIRNVVPILHEYDAPATVFVVAETLDDPSFTHMSGTENEYLSQQDIERLVDDDLVTIGNHTRTHPFLSECSEDELHDEIIGAKERLEGLFGIDVTQFSYPANDVSDRAAGIVRDSHEIGLTRRGNREFVDPDGNPALVPRVKGEHPSWRVRWELTDLGTNVGQSVQTHLGIESKLG
ncbi:polysaccharide deacetylase family protein [Halonotius roseus]|uniref:Polysaccharide deacetylase family protein n=1 Tax=Halonotius roseus TaxID=2511997 RepID=A0A544QMW2_9EURY|nr:polysaccharide deacetylase family protein [Halonotius roseus]TQQ80252.1 polysaccharide deacetylase family protein [Halonotius roseus]